MTIVTCRFSARGPPSVAPQQIGGGQLLNDGDDEHPRTGRRTGRVERPAGPVPVPPGTRRLLRLVRADLAVVYRHAAGRGAALLPGRRQDPGAALGVRS